MNMVMVSENFLEQIYQGAQHEIPQPSENGASHRQDQSAARDYQQTDAEHPGTTRKWLIGIAAPNNSCNAHDQIYYGEYNYFKHHDALRA